MRIAADQRWLQTVIRFQAGHRAKRRLWAHENSADVACGRAQIFRFCVVSPFTSQVSRSEELNATVIIAIRLARGNEASYLPALPDDAAGRPARSS